MGEAKTDFRKKKKKKGKEFSWKSLPFLPEFFIFSCEKWGGGKERKKGRCAFFWLTWENLRFHVVRSKVTHIPPTYPPKYVFFALLKSFKNSVLFFFAGVYTIFCFFLKVAGVANGPAETVDGEVDSCEGLIGGTWGL